MSFQLACEVSEGLRHAEASVKVTDYHDSTEFFPLDRGMISEDGGVNSIPVFLIRYSPERDFALVGLPVEADSGTNRIWVRTSDLKEALEPVP